MSKTKNYVNNAELLVDLTKFKQQCRQAEADGKPRPPVPRYTAECIMKIAENYGKKSKFSGYTYLDEMIGDAVENCCMYIHNFDETKFNNPFAYITRIVHFAFIRRIQKEKKQVYLKYKSAEQFLLDDEFASLYQDNSETHKQISEIIESNKPKKKEDTANTLVKFLE